MSETKVYPALEEHQKVVEQHSGSEHVPEVVRAQAVRFGQWMKEFHRWKEIYVSDFKIEIPPVAFCIKSTKANCLGYFRPGINEFGLTREIAINRLHLETREPWQVLGTLLHELLHAWQDAFGTPGKRNYHNTAFQKRAAEFGLLIDSRGYTQYAPKSRFMDLLQKYEVKVPDLTAPILVTRVPGKSTLVKWVCQCDPPVAARIGRGVFRARCLDCKKRFKKG